ncbi:MAG: peptidoglycan-binding domain-containing protein [Candidatus Acidiferrales bacterium]
MTASRRTFLPFLSAALLGGMILAVSAFPATAPQTSSVARATHKTTKKRARHARDRGQKAPTPDRIMEIQTALVRENAYRGAPNGRWDTATVEAMRRFQDANGLNPTGKIDALTLQKLGLGSEVAGKGAPTPPAGPEPGSPADSEIR